FRTLALTPRDWWQRVQQLDTELAQVNDLIQFQIRNNRYPVALITQAQALVEERSRAEFMAASPAAQLRLTSPTSNAWLPKSLRPLPTKTVFDII
ncbi:hypothetical protein DFQ27_009979, partial [Actinomortierella ambigua]